MEESKKQGMAAVTGKDLLTTSEAAEILGVKTATLEQWRWNGKGARFVKLNRSVRYRRSDLDEFIEARIYGSTTEAQAGDISYGK